MQQSEPDLRQLTRRVERLELLVVQVVAGMGILALLAGSVLPYVPAARSEDTSDDLPRLLTAGFGLIGYRDSEGDPEPFALVAGIGFLGLVLVALLVAATLFVIATGTATEGTGRWLRVLVRVLSVGTAVAAFIALIGLGSDEADVGWGIVVFATGVALSRALYAVELSRWWDPARR